MHYCPRDSLLEKHPAPASSALQARVNEGYESL